MIIAKEKYKDTYIIYIDESDQRPFSPYHDYNEFMGPISSSSVMNLRFQRGTD